jgi:molecular chaperone HscA
VNEPTAASLAYGIGLNPDEEKVIAVYDLGGGTFDVSILKIQNGIFEVLSTNGDTFLGGDDFDQAIVKYWIEQNKLENKLGDSSFNQALRLKAEEAKKALTNQNIFNDFVGDIPCAITKIKFEELISVKVNQTIDCCKNALKDAGLTIADIQEVVMVGGSTRTPLVKKRVADFFEKEVHDQINPDEVVALEKIFYCLM